jgi:hypothetical protein
MADSKSARLPALFATDGRNGGSIQLQHFVFQDRRQMISYACEAPSLVEQRLFAFSRVIRRL